MSSLKHQEMAIEETRLRLHQLVADLNGDLGCPQVNELSGYLDQLIVEYERSKREFAK